jgi:hypothetical protein
MSIKVKNQDSKDSIEITVDNGDFQALVKIREKWGFKDHESSLRFAIAVLMLAEDKIVYVGKDGKDGLRPNSSLLEEGAILSND